MNIQGNWRECQISYKELNIRMWKKVSQTGSHSREGSQGRIPWLQKWAETWIKKGNHGTCKRKNIAGRCKGLEIELVLTQEPSVTGVFWSRGREKQDEFIDWFIDSFVV